MSLTGPQDERERERAVCRRATVWTELEQKREAMTQRESATREATQLRDGF